jgi:hypothetical protein
MFSWSWPCAAPVMVKATMMLPRMRLTRCMDHGSFDQVVARQRPRGVDAFDTVPGSRSSANVNDRSVRP